MDMIQLRSQVDWLQMDKEWTLASQEEAKYMIKRSTNNALYFRVSIIVGILCALLLFLVPLMMTILFEEESSILTLVVCFGLSLALIVFFVLRGDQLVERYNRKELIVEKKKVFFVNVVTVRYGIKVSYIEQVGDDEVQICNIYNTSTRIKLRTKIKKGDALILLRTSNGVLEVDGKTECGNLLDCNEEILFQKMADERLYKGNDHRIIDFYMKRTASYVCFLAVKKRLDVYDDNEVPSLTKYCVETHNLQENVDPKLFTLFRHRIVEEVQQEMESLVKEG